MRKGRQVVEIFIDPPPIYLLFPKDSKTDVKKVKKKGGRRIKEGEKMSGNSGRLKRERK